MWSTGKVFVLDSGFCVLQAIVELKKRGLFAAALIKKCRYWPKYVPGDEIIAHLYYSYDILEQITGSTGMGNGFLVDSTVMGG